jgi:phospholipase C
VHVALHCGLGNVVTNFGQVADKEQAMGVKHVFVLMLENRSSDHMLGFADLSGVHAVTGQPTLADDLSQLQASPDWSRTGNINPRSGTVVYPQPGAPVKLYPPAPGPSHEFLDVLMQLCGSGASCPDATAGGYPPITGTGFVHNYAAIGAFDPTLVMQCFDPTHVPVLTALAREFAVCDHWFSSLPGPSWPNRHFVHAASSGGLDDSPPGLTVMLEEIGQGYAFENGTIFDRLGDDWLVFHGDALPHVFSIKGMLEPRFEGHFHPQGDLRDIVSADDFTAKYVFTEPHYGRVYGDYAYGTSQHPLDDVTRGEQLIKDVYEAIRNSPHWNDSALVVTYDEHGGFYDHVVPPAATAPGDRALAASAISTALISHTSAYACRRSSSRPSSHVARSTVASTTMRPSRPSSSTSSICPLSVDDGT